MSTCSGFGVAGQATWPTLPGWNGGGFNGDTRDYGYTYFEGCIYGLGDAGTLWSFDPLSGSYPCSKAIATVDFDQPTGLYCDGQPHLLSWGSIRLEDQSALPLLSSVNIRFFDQSETALGNPAGYSMPLSGIGAGVLDISSVPALLTALNGATGGNVSVRIQVNGARALIFRSGSPPIE